ncbi:MAG: T9SS type A sorting domain-containing protein [Flavobacteriales bacterium]|nr:T9SS type A sorting domain-containing protein [Flavobacteriales bacterium]
MPAYMHDAAFLNNQMGFALGDDGNIHGTTNGGVDWITAYAAGAELFKVEFMNGVGYAVGENGALVKYEDGTISIFENESDRSEMEVLPNPATDRARIRSSVQINSISIRGSNGALVWSGNSSGRELTIDLSDFANGAYLVEVTDTEGNVQSRKLMKVGIY